MDLKGFKGFCLVSGDISREAVCVIKYFSKTNMTKHQQILQQHIKRQEHRSESYQKSIDTERILQA